MIKAGKPGTPEIGRLPYMAADYLRSRNVVTELDSAGKHLRRASAKRISDPN